MIQVMKLIMNQKHDNIFRSEDRNCFNFNKKPPKVINYGEDVNKKCLIRNQLRAGAKYQHIMLVILASGSRGRGGGRGAGAAGIPA